ncbi:polysaccharide biosynthesis protein [Haloferax sp. BAB-2207]|nr:polysaccharide biosynthesis protein [Haloferax sp. BAB-2207]
MLAGYSVITILSGGGLFDATRKFIAEQDEIFSNDSAIITTAFLISAIYAVVTSAIILSSVALGIVPRRYISFAWILIAAVLFINLFNIVRGSFYGLHRESVGEVLKITQKLIYVISALILAYYGLGVFGVFTGYTFSFVILSVYGIVLLFREVPPMLPDIDKFTKFGKKMASFGGYQLLGGLSAMLLYRSDILLINFFKGSSTTALYQSAIVPAEMIWFVPSAIQLAFLQHTASLWSSNEIDKISENLHIGIKYSILSLTLFGAGLFVLSDSFLRVYFGSSYAQAALTLQILIFGTFFFGISRTIVPVFQATGWIKQTELITVCALILNLLLNTILIPRYGIIGAGVGTATSYVAIFIGNTLLWRYSPFKFVSVKWISKVILPQVIFSVIFFTISITINISPLNKMLVLPPIGLIVFLILNILFGHIPIHSIRTKLGL